MEESTATAAATTSGSLVDSIGPTINSLAIFFQEGGFFMWIILFIFVIGLGIALERFSKLIFKYDIDGSSFMNEIQRYILSNDIQGAIRICSGTEAALPRVLKGALKRASSSLNQVQNAIDATALEVIPKLEKRLNYMQLIASISTLLGLLGTIQGLIQSFAAVSVADPAQKGELLSLGISKAMNTTYLGLISAIVLMVLHTYFSSRAEKIISEIDEFSVKIMDLIGTKKDQN